MKKNNKTFAWKNLCTITAILLLATIFSSSLMLPGLIRNNISLNRISTPTPVNINEDAPIKLWNTTWGGSLMDDGRHVAIDASGNVYVAGFTYSFTAGLADFALVKFAPDGTKLWNTTWGGGLEDQGRGVAVDPSGNVYISGYTNSFSEGGADLALIKYTSDGTKLWNTTWGGPLDEFGQGILVDSSGNIFISGITTSFSVGGWDVALLKFDSSGNKLWNTSWGGADQDSGRDVVMDSSGNFYVSGSTASFGAGGNDFSLVKFDSNGVPLWNVTWGGTGTEFGWGVAIDTSGNVYTSGYTTGFGAGGYDIALVKFDSNGNILWNTTWGGGSADYSRDIAIDTCGNVIVPGYTSSFSVGSYDIALIKYASNGTQLWNTTWGDVGLEEIWGIAVDSSGNAFLSGNTGSFGEGLDDFMLIKYKIGDPCKESIPGFEIIFILVALFPLIAIGLYSLTLRRAPKLHILLVS